MGAQQTACSIREWFQPYWRRSKQPDSHAHSAVPACCRLRLDEKLYHYTKYCINLGCNVEVTKDAQFLCMVDAAVSCNSETGHGAGLRVVIGCVREGFDIRYASSSFWSITVLPDKLLKLRFLHALHAGALRRETPPLNLKYERLGNLSLTKDGGLVWAVPTMQRTNNAQYLSATVESILQYNVRTASRDLGRQRAREHAAATGGGARVEAAE